MWQHVKPTLFTFDSVNISRRSNSHCSGFVCFGAVSRSWDRDVYKHRCQAGYSLIEFSFVAGLVGVFLVGVDEIPHWANCKRRIPWAVGLYGSDSRCSSVHPSLCSKIWGILQYTCEYRMPQKRSFQTFSSIIGLWRSFDNYRATTVVERRQLVSRDLDTAVTAIVLLVALQGFLIVFDVISSLLFPKACFHLLEDAHRFPVNKLCLYMFNIFATSVWTSGI